LLSFLIVEKCFQKYFYLQAVFNLYTVSLTKYSLKQSFLNVKNLFGERSLNSEILIVQ